MTLVHLQAPLLVGCDVRNISAEAFEILSNEEVIAVNQGENSLLTPLSLSVSVTCSTLNFAALLHHYGFRYLLPFQFIVPGKLKMEEL